MTAPAPPRLMFLVNLDQPSRPIVERTVAVKVCKKTVWAIEANGRRHLVGSSAFQTLAAADRCRTALLQKIVNTPYNKYHRPYAFTRAQEELAKVLH